MTKSDLDKLIRLEAFLSNEPESRVHPTVCDLSGKSDDELRAIVAEEASLLQSLTNRSSTK